MHHAIFSTQVSVVAGLLGAARLLMSVARAV